MNASGGRQPKIASTIRTAETTSRTDLGQDLLGALRPVACSLPSTKFQRGMSMDGPQETADGKASMNALDVLRYDWGSAYEIESADGEWRARRLDGLGDWIEAEIPDDLRNQIFSDYALKPVRMRGCEAEILQGGGN
jgi:hypothetical protein